MKRVYLAITAFLVGPGCAMFERKVEYVPFERRIPIAVPCAAETPEEPAWATRDMPHVDPKTGENIDIAADKLTAERQQRIGYEKKLKAAVEGCQ